MPHTYTNGVVTFYEDAGDGPIVVLVHGYGGDLRLWDAQTAPLSDAGFRVIRYDIRGHGRSLIAPDGYTYENYAADLRDLLDRLNVERPVAEGLSVGPVHLVGLSMGGGVVLQFALDHPDRVLSLTLVDSALPGFTYDDETTAHIQQFMQAVQADGARAAIDNVWLQHPFFDGVRRDPQLFESVRKILLDFQAPDMREGARPVDYHPDLASRLAEIRAPTLVIAGENDIPDFRLIADLLAENIQNARRDDHRGLLAPAAEREAGGVQPTPNRIPPLRLLVTDRPRFLVRCSLFLASACIICVTLRTIEGEHDGCLRSDQHHPRDAPPQARPRSRRAHLEDPRCRDPRAERRQPAAVELSRHPRRRGEEEESPRGTSKPGTHPMAR